jgi:hypothetical protein
LDTQYTSCLATRFAPVIAAHAGGAFLTGPMREALRLHHEGDLEVVWAPFDHIVPNAKLVIVGITPGAQQAENANTAFHTALAGGHSPVEAARRAKLTGAFSGPMRSNLVAMLDHVGAQKFFGIRSCADLFDPDQNLVHLTSALRHPVFVGSQNYNGTPDMLRTPVLKTMVETHLAAEARALPEALWLPLGDKPAAALRYLATLGLLELGRILDGMPHPSGANAERVAFFMGRKPAEALSEKTRPGPIVEARERLRTQLARLEPAV